MSIVTLVLLIEIPFSALLVYFIVDHQKRPNQKLFLKRLIVVSVVQTALLVILLMRFFSSQSSSVI